MAPELSANWKKLQAEIKAESSKHTTKRKSVADGESGLKNPPRKKQKTDRRQRVAPAGDRSAVPTPSTAAQRAKKEMGGAQSTRVVEPSTPAISPALALFAEDNDISAEDIAQAYGLGVHSRSLLLETESKPNDGLADDIEVGKYIAMDCEMVGIGPGGHESALARVSIVDFHGQQVYDSFVRQQEIVVDWRTHVSGVSSKNMATARGFQEVQAQVSTLLKDRILVGHDLRHDLHALLLDHPLKFVRDTARFSGFKKYGHGRKPALRDLAQGILGVEIQNGQHSSIEDARVAMLLFRKHKSAFDVEHAARFSDAVTQPQPPKVQKKTRKSKKKRKK